MVLIRNHLPHATSTPAELLFHALNFQKKLRREQAAKKLLTGAPVVEILKLSGGQDNAAAEV
ncbi:hypothetical protein [uncultured Victivallis sp.]|uniref:hypothetical protein n=1 Tax=uncultured Victivallis sp. TaxID=354118 RepID=UPI0025DE818F|nr:hypothetical protein [uncultured Victivallis sp.]